MRWRKWLLVVSVLIAVLAVTAVVVVILFLRSLSQPAEATARFIPDDAPVYVSFNFRPGLNQISRGRDVMSLLKTNKYVELRDDLLEQVEDETGLHLLEDIQSWLGTDVSFALLDADTEQPEWVVLAQVGDQSAVRDFIEDLVWYLEDEADTDFNVSSYRESDLWVAQNGPMALGLSSAYLVIGDSERTVTGAIRRIEAPPDRPLAQNEHFLAARESLPSDRVMFLFAQTDDLQDLADESAGILGTEGTFGNIADQIPEYVAASVSFIENGVSIELVSDIPPGASNSGLSHSPVSPAVLPSDTLLLIGGTGITEAWYEGLDSLGDVDPEALEFLDDALDDLWRETGIDLEQDVIDALSGEVALALLPSDIRFDRDGNLSGFVETLLLASVRDQDSIREALDIAIQRVDGSNNSDLPSGWKTLTKVVVPSLPLDEQTQISLQRAYNLAYSDRILDLGGDPIPQSDIYLTLDAEIVGRTVIDAGTGRSLGSAVELAAAGRLLRPFEEESLTVAMLEESSRPSVKQIYAVVANPEIQIAQRDAVDLADAGELLDLAGNRLARARVESSEALGMEVQVMPTTTRVRVARSQPLIVQEVRPPIGYARSTEAENLLALTEQLTLNGYEAVTFSLNDFDLPLDMEPAYMVTDEWAAIGSTLSSLEQFHTTVSGATPSLRSTGRFEALAEGLPAPLHFVTYADIAAITAMIDDALPSGTRREYRREVKPFLDPFDAVMIASSMVEDQLRLTIRLSLREP